MSEGVSIKVNMPLFQDNELGPGWNIRASTETILPPGDRKWIKTEQRVEIQVFII